MSRTAKIVLIVVGSITALAIAGGVLVWRFIAGNFTTDSVEVVAIGQEIVPHELPPGYVGEFGTDFFGFKVMAALDTFGTESMIMLISLPEGGTEAELRDASRDQFNSQRGAAVDFEYVDSRTVTIRGEEVALDRYVGTEDDVTVVQEIAIFEALGDRAGLLLLFAEDRLYEEAGFDQFLKSLE